MYYYWAYGLEIQSEMEFPEMLPHKAETFNLSIRFGRVPLTINGEDFLKKGRLFISPTEYLLHLPICSYYVKEGKEIIIELQPGADDKSVRLFLLTNAMAAVLHQRNKVALHSGAVIFQDGLFLICGESGAGKSTTISALQQKGYRVFADDVVVLEKNKDGQAIAYASYPIIKLWEDSIEKLGMGGINEETKLREHVAKYRRHFHEDFTRQAMPIRQVFILKKDGAVAEPQKKHLIGVQAFMELQAQLYRSSQYSSSEMKAVLFNSISALAGKIPIQIIHRPVEGNSIEKVITLIQDSFTELS